jgi:hypothetical protein
MKASEHRAESSILQSWLGKEGEGVKREMFIQEKSLKIFPRITKPENFRFI